MQAARCCGSVDAAGRRSSGSTVLHSAIAIGQRGLKRQPGGMWIEFGVSPAEDLRRAAVARVALRHDGEEGAGVRVLRVLDHLARRPLLDDPAQVHDGDPIGVVGCSREVVRDHQHREALVSELVEDGQDPGPDRHVEHRDGLVGDEKLGTEDEARGDRHSLPLPARKLVWVAVDVELGRSQAGELERALDLLAPLLLGADLVHLQWFLDRRPDPETRIQRLVWVLVDDLHPPAKWAQRLGREPGDFLAVEPDRAAARLDEPQHRLRRRGLPAPRLADEGEHLAPAQREGDAVDCVHLELRLTLRRADEPAPDGVARDEALHFQQRLRAVRAHAVAASRTWSFR